MNMCDSLPCVTHYHVWLCVIMSHRVMNITQSHMIMWHIHMCDSWICVTCLIHMCDMTQTLFVISTRRSISIHSYVWHDSFVRVTWLIRMYIVTYSYEWLDSFVRVTWLIHMCDMTQIPLWFQHDAAFWFIRTCAMTPSYVHPHAFIWVTRLVVRMCDMTHSYVWHDLNTFVISTRRSLKLELFQGGSQCVCVCATQHFDSFVRMTWLIRMYIVTHSYEWLDSFVCVTWLIHMCDMTRIPLWFQHDAAFCRYTSFALACPPVCREEDSECVCVCVCVCMSGVFCTRVSPSL